MLEEESLRGVILESAPSLLQIPVVVLTSSEAEQDIAKAYELHANCYVTKPVDLDRFVPSAEAPSMRRA